MDRNRALHETLVSLPPFTWSSWLSVLSDRNRSDLIIDRKNWLSSNGGGLLSIVHSSGMMTYPDWILAVKVHEIPRLCLNVYLLVQDLQPSKPKALYYEKACWLNPMVMFKCQPCSHRITSMVNIKHHIPKKHVQKNSKVILKCYHCSNGFTSPANLKHHILKKHVQTSSLC